MFIRSFRPRDAAALGMVFYRSVREVGSARYSPLQVEVWAPAAPSPQTYLARAEDGRFFLVAVDDQDAPVAYGDLTPGGHIDHLYCAPQVTRSGIASALLYELERSASRQGMETLSSHASELARSVFQKHGFHVVERRDFLLAGVAIHNYRVEKRLQL